MSEQHRKDTPKRRADKREAQRRWRAKNPRRPEELARRRERAREPATRAKRNARLAARRKARTAFLNRYKLAAGCIDCGYAAHAVVLDFDHVQGVKLFTIANMVHRPAALLVAELSKCVVRCANCHRVKTHV